MKLSMNVRHLPGRVATGAFILHTGLEKRNSGDEQAAGIHGMAAGAFPFLNAVPPRKFLKLLAAAEIAPARSCSHRSCPPPWPVPPSPRSPAAC
jgi:hypothetical protein